mmetsp:Transcript_23583/g.34590  ORF Transcript_23583/g.34590 Transcript_23583/m.34590 type:complete len:203 (-) Transcript_23583:2057-2665(-)
MGSIVLSIPVCLSLGCLVVDNGPLRSIAACPLDKESPVLCCGIRPSTRCVFGKISSIRDRKKGRSGWPSFRKSTHSPCGFFWLRAISFFINVSQSLLTTAPLAIASRNLNAFLQIADRGPSSFSAISMNPKSQRPFSRVLNIASYTLTTSGGRIRISWGAMRYIIRSSLLLLPMENGHIMGFSSVLVFAHKELYSDPVMSVP